MIGLSCDQTKDNFIVGLLGEDTFVVTTSKVHQRVLRGLQIDAPHFERDTYGFVRVGFFRGVIVACMQTHHTTRCPHSIYYYWSFGESVCQQGEEEHHSEKSKPSMCIWESELISSNKQEHQQKCPKVQGVAMWYLVNFWFHYTILEEMCQQSCSSEMGNICLLKCQTDYTHVWVHPVCKSWFILWLAQPYWFDHLFLPILWGEEAERLSWEAEDEGQHCQWCHQANIHWSLGGGHREGSQVWGVPHIHRYICVYICP